MRGHGDGITPPDDAMDFDCLERDDPVAMAITCIMYAYLEAHHDEASLFDTPEWLLTFAWAQARTGRSFNLDERGLPSPYRVHDEVCAVSRATSTNRVVQILALGLLDLSLIHI